MKRLFLILATAAMPVVSFAQGAFSMDQKGGGFYVAPLIYFSNVQSQYSALHLDSTLGNDTSQLFDRNAVAYPMPSNSLIGITIGGYGISSNIIYGGELNTYYGASKSISLVDSNKAQGEPDYNYSLKHSVLGADVLAKIGIIALRQEGFTVFPEIGLGYGIMGQFINDSRGTRQYPVYMGGNNSNQENRFVYNMGFTFDVGLGADYYFGSTKSKAKGFRLGVKVGYRTQSAGDWKSSGSPIQSSIGGEAIPTRLLPSKEGSNGVYLKLILGVGSMGKK